MFGGYAAQHAALEDYWRDQAAAMLQYQSKAVAEGSPSEPFAAQAAYDLAQSRYHGALRIKYERAAEVPLRPVSPDPPPMRLSPRDFLRKKPVVMPGPD